MTIGDNKPLYILPFDHRNSLERGLFGWTGPLTEEQSERIVQSKAIIYAAFKLSLTKGISKEDSGIFVDSQFGAAILRDAHVNGYIADGSFFVAPFVAQDAWFIGPFRAGPVQGCSLQTHPLLR
jgi:hypothetical protein